jgi:adenosine deaminase CECR1
MPAHPLPVMINQGIPVCLNSDDPAVFGAMGLSYDFFQVLVSSEISGMLTLAQLARDSLRVRLLCFVHAEKNLTAVLSSRRWAIKKRWRRRRRGRDVGRRTYGRFN